MSLTADTGICLSIETDVDNFLSKDHRKMSDNIIRFQTLKPILQDFPELTQQNQLSQNGFIKDL